MHHGVLGMHWGIRRYQNKDGTLTAEGKRRLKTDANFKAKVENYEKKDSLKAKGVKGIANYLTRRYMEKNPITGYQMDEEAAIEKAIKDTKAIKAIAIGAAVATTASLVPAAAVMVTNYNRFKSAKSAAESLMDTAASKAEESGKSFAEEVAKMDKEFAERVSAGRGWFNEQSAESNARYEAGVKAMESKAAQWRKEHGFD